jgi:hypothetical protein
MRRCILPFLAATAVLVRPVASQSQVTGLRDLDFGVVVPNVPSSVAPSDPIRSGRFYVRHLINHQVQLTFTLPTRLNRVGGGTNMPISFGTTDAIAQGTAASSQPVTFNPNNPMTFTLGTSADFYVNLGGRVAPRNSQPVGSYQGTVTLTCVFF